MKTFSQMHVLREEHKHWLVCALQFLTNIVAAVRTLLINQIRIVLRKVPRTYLIQTADTQQRSLYPSHIPQQDGTRQIIGRYFTLLWPFWMIFTDVCVFITNYTCQNKKSSNSPKIVELLEMKIWARVAPILKRIGIKSGCYSKLQTVCWEHFCDVWIWTAKPTHKDQIWSNELKKTFY